MQNGLLELSRGTERLHRTSSSVDHGLCTARGGG